MRKVRRFRIELRRREWLRRARKARLDPASLGLGDEAGMAAFASSLQETFASAVLWRSFPAGDPRAHLAPVSGLGFTVGLATLGPRPDQFCRALVESRQEGRHAMARIGVELALEDAVAFALGLIKAEASEEGCELSPLSSLREMEGLGTAIEALEASKVGVTLQDGQLDPLGTAAFCVSWIARPRSRRTAPQRR